MQRRSGPRATITVPIEAKVRELDEKVLLAGRLAIDGHEVILGTDGACDDYATERGVDVHFLNGAVPSLLRRRSLPALARRGVRILVLDAEGANATPTPSARARFDPAILPSIHRYLAWGTAPASVATDAIGLSPDRVVVTGIPRFDTLREPYDVVHRDARAKIRARHGKYVLVNTNHTRVNPFARNVVRVLAEDDEAVTNQRALMKAYAEAIPEIVRRIPGLNVVVRPHPGENVDTYRVMFAGLPNVRVVHEGSVQPWIKEAVAVVHNNCLTGVEAAVAGVPVIALSTTGWSQPDFTIANAVSLSAENTEQLVELLRACHDGSPPTPKLSQPGTRDALKSIIDNVSSPAVDVVAEIVRQTVEGTTVQHVTPDLRTRARRAILTVLGQRGLHVVRRIHHRRNLDRYEYATHKMSGITRAEVEGRLAPIAARLGWPTLDVKRVRGFEHTFRIRTA